MPDINDFFQDLLRPFNNCTDSAKKSLLVVYDEANKDGIMDEDEVPPIQEINSFSPTSIESALTDKSLKDDIDEHNANHNGLSLFVAAEKIERATHCIVISGREGSYKFNCEILTSQWCPSEEIASEI